MTLWMTRQLRYFLVPADFAWPPGELVVADVRGVERRVDTAAITPFLATPEEARRFSEGETARLNAEMDARIKPPPSFEELRGQIEALAAQAGGLDDRVTHALAELGMPLERVLANPEATITLWAEVMATVSLARDRAAKERLPSQLQALFIRHGYPETAQQLRTAPARLRKWAESVQKQGTTMTPKQRITTLLTQLRGALTEGQVDEVESNLDVGETLLALEFLVDFLLDRDATVTTAQKAEIVALAKLLGSTRKGPHVLPVKD